MTVRVQLIIDGLNLRHIVHPKNSNNDFWGLWYNEATSVSHSETFNGESDQMNHGSNQSKYSMFTIRDINPHP